MCACAVVDIALKGCLHQQELAFRIAGIGWIEEESFGCPPVTKNGVLSIRASHSKGTNNYVFVDKPRNFR